MTVKVIKTFSLGYVKLLWYIMIYGLKARIKDKALFEPFNLLQFLMTIFTGFHAVLSKQIKKTPAEWGHVGAALMSSLYFPVSCSYFQWS